MDIETNGLFIITFINGVVNRRDKLLEYLTKNRKIKIKEYMNLVSISFRTAQRDLVLFQKQGLITFTGAPKTGHYKLVNAN